MKKKQLYFVTGNQHKWKEAQAILGDDFGIVQKNIDLQEVQTTSVATAIKAKLRQAYEMVQSPVFCEDTGLFIADLNGFPGALIRFYLKHLGTTGISKQTPGAEAYAETVVGYHDGDTSHFFTGRVAGTIAVKPAGEGFGWDPVFIPKGYDQTFAEMDEKLKNNISMRSIAMQKLRDYCTIRG